MIKDNDEGSLFTSEGANVSGTFFNTPSHGMTLRDYFAVHATEADIAEFLPVQYAQSQSRSGLATGYGYNQTNEYDLPRRQNEMQAKVTRQEARFKYADAMIEARNK